VSVAIGMARSSARWSSGWRGDNAFGTLVEARSPPNHHDEVLGDSKAATISMVSPGHSPRHLLNGCLKYRATVDSSASAGGGVVDGLGRIRAEFGSRPVLAGQERASVALQVRRLTPTKVRILHFPHNEKVTRVTMATWWVSGMLHEVQTDSALRRWRPVFSACRDLCAATGVTLLPSGHSSKQTCRVCCDKGREGELCSKALLPREVWR